MEIKINIEKKYAYAIMSLLTLVLLAVGLNALTADQKNTQAWHNTNTIDYTSGLNLTGTLLNRGIFRDEDYGIISFRVGEKLLLQLRKESTSFKSNVSIDPGYNFKLPSSESIPFECNSVTLGSMYIDTRDEDHWNWPNSVLCICLNENTDFRWTTSNDWGTRCK